jgi:hypothetical protein
MIMLLYLLLRGSGERMAAREQSGVLGGGGGSLPGQCDLKNL